MKKEFYQKTIVVWFGALICCLLWGSAFPCVKIGYSLFGITSSDTASQIFFAGVRFTFAGILTVILGSIASKKLLIPKRGSLSKIFRLSLMQTVGQYLFFYIGLARTAGVRASIIDGGNTIFCILIAALIFRMEKITPGKLAGMIIGFAGVLCVTLTGGLTADAGYLLGDIFILISALCYSMSSVFVKIYSRDESVAVLSGYQFIIGGLVLVVIGTAAGGSLPVVESTGIAMLVYLSFVSAVAYTIWGILMAHNPVSKVSVFGFMNPAFGVILSAILLKEGSVINASTLIALVLICISIVIINRKEE